ncbi:TQO small subunit DoxD [Yinghuangia aomiensis]
MFLLPLRVFLGLAFLLEGLRKFYDPGFLDADAPDSFAHHIQALHDGSWFPPVMDLAADHAITTGLLFAFGQVLVGVGALLGLWTRLMGLIGMLLALGVLIAVGGNSSPYHGAYVVFLAAWSPLALAGAPMYSVDCWLSLRKRRGPLTTPVRARRRKLGYGSIIAGLAVGTTLLAGALFGHPARDGSAPGADETTVTGPPAVRTSTGPAGLAPAAPPAAPAPPAASGTASATAKPTAGAGVRVRPRRRRRRAPSRRRRPRARRPASPPRAAATRPRRRRIRRGRWRRSRPTPRPWAAARPRRAAGG